MHLAAGDHVDAGDLLFQDRRLRRAQLGVGKIARGELACSHEPVQGLIPARHAVRADHRGRVSVDNAAWRLVPFCLMQNLAAFAAFAGSSEK